MWQNETSASHIAIATMVNWRWTGYNALILLAAMQAVPRDYLRIRRDRRCGSRPPVLQHHPASIRPTMIFVIITATIGGLQIFTEPRLFDPVTAGGSQRQFQTTVLYLWEMAFQRQNFGKASTIAWLLFLIIVLFGVINYLISRRIATAGESRSASASRACRATKAPHRAERTAPMSIIDRAEAAVCQDSLRKTPPTEHRASEADPAASASSAPANAPASSATGCCSRFLCSRLPAVVVRGDRQPVKRSPGRDRGRRCCPAGTSGRTSAKSSTPFRSGWPWETAS